MRIIGMELQHAGIDFIDVQAVTSRGRVRITGIVLASVDDLVRFNEWTRGADVEVEILGVRVATAKEIEERDRMS